MSIGAYIVGYLLLLSCGAVCVMKGKRGFVAMGVLVPFAWVLGALSPAKPESLWAWTVAEASSAPRA